MKGLRALAGGLLGLLVLGLVACGGAGKPSPEQIARICEEHSDEIDRIRRIVERRGRSVLERIRRRARGHGVQFIIEHCLDRGTDVPELNPTDVDQTVATSTFDSTRFLYTGDNPVQTGVDSGTIEYKRVAVIRGRVLDENGDPLSGATVQVLNHPEFGQTVSREDGFYDMAVNGGKEYTMQARLDGRLPVQRPVQVPWRDIARVEPFRMVGADTAVTTVDLTESQDIQVHEANTESDSDGTRTTRLAFKPNTNATLIRTDGDTETLDSLNVRATEYSVGENGPEKMPAPLPKNTLYTYAVELSADRALDDTTVKRIDFSKPVSLYVDNFLSFPVGSPVPSGFYDDLKGQWVPADTAARVMKVVSISNDQAQLDVDGDGTADGATQLASLRITSQEQTTIANQFDAGDSFWRAPAPHFTSWDLNSGSAFPGFDLDLSFPNIPGQEQICQPCEQSGSTIELQNQVLGESLNLVGTPLDLSHRTNRTRGFESPYKMDIQLSKGTVPEDLKGIALQVRIAGKIFEKVFDPKPNLSYEFEWNGKDVYGRTLQSPQNAQVTITYLFPGAYAIPEKGTNTFGKVGGSPTSTLQAREDVPVVNVFNKALGTFRSKALKMGGWTLENHHFYDPDKQVLYRGDGTSRAAAEATSDIIKTVAGGGPGISGDSGLASQADLGKPMSIQVTPDGGYYFLDRAQRKIFRVDPDGFMHTVAGGGSSFDEGIPATQAELGVGDYIELAPNGDLYFAERSRNRIRKISDGGTITTVVGTGQTGFNGDNIPATEANINKPMGMDVDAQGNLYFADQQQRRVRQVTSAGLITTVAGGGSNRKPPDGTPALNAYLEKVQDVELSPDGVLHFLQTGKPKPDLIHSIQPDGTLRRVAGKGRKGKTGIAPDGTPARKGKIDDPWDIVFGPDRTIFMSEGHFFKDSAHVRKVTPQGLLFKVAGIGPNGFSGDGGPALRAQISGAGREPRGIDLSPSGEIFLADSSNHRIRKITPAHPQLSLGQHVLPSEDGSRIFVFNNRGRHLRTIDARTGTTLFNFSYNDAGLLTSVTDRDGQTTTIERDSSGQATAIVTPFGQRTELTTNSNGFLTEVTNPASEAHQMTYSDSGLLQSFTDPKGNQTTYTYEENGRLAREEDPKGGFTELARSFSDTTFKVQTTTAEGRTRSFRVTRNSVGDQIRKNVGTDGLPITQDRNRDGTRSIERSDGTSMATVLGPDPRFEMQSPITEGQMIKTPGGRELAITQSSTATAGDSLGFLESSTDQVSINGRTFRQEYDGSTRTVTNTSPEGRVTTTQLNDQSRVAQITQGDLLPTSFTYNDQGQLTQTTQGDRTSEFTYNSEGFLDSVIGPTGRTTQFSYDNAGRVTTQTLPDGRQIGFQYDDNGNLTSLTPPGRNAHVFRYTSRDQTQEYDPPDLPSGATITTWTYNLDRQLTQIQRPDMSTVNFGYDNAGRLSSVGFPADQRSLSYSSSTGNLTGIQSDNGVNLSFAYDGSLSTEVQWDGTDLNGSLSLNYDDNFRVTQQTINGSTSVSFSYDRDGLLTGAGDLMLDRDAQTGLLSGSSLGDVQTSWSHNDFGEVTSRSTSYSGNPRYSFTAQRDQAGRIVILSEDVVGQATRTRGFEYDEAGRLVGVNHGDGDTVGYEYDSNGNRTARTGAGVDQTDFSYDAQDRLLSYRKNGDTLVEFGYTANGELQSKTVGSHSPTTYDYDAMGNLRSVTLKGDTTIEYLIDGQNRRVGKKVNGQFKQGFIYQEQLNPVAELDKNGNVEAVFIYGTKAHVPSYMIKDGTKYRIVSNQLGSVRMVVNASNGNIVQRMKYDEFGRVVEDSNPGLQPFGFTGGLYDHQTGLVRFGARDYDPQVGRWTSKDPLLFGGGTTNLYGYVVNNPINFKDAQGLFSITLVNRKGARQITNDVRLQTGQPLKTSSVDHECVQSCLNDFPITPNTSLGEVGDLPFNLFGSSIEATGMFFEFLPGLSRVGRSILGSFGPIGSLVANIPEGIRAYCRNTDECRKERKACPISSSEPAS